ncbi:unnamed protein product [Zymoseptoria tritici ST99CH_1E4]|uniref:Uncharacterized protein n=1 Tax=Zymoseptoria tritici ST99CH_1E4 TaxID=1276532 RepID=A0A2H1GCS5_ZYMTR|nr:unnamed protein product [Zymoseptoria tritici ST99CH_1E4]
MAPPIRTHYDLPDRTKPSTRPPCVNTAQQLSVSNAAKAKANAGRRHANASESFLVGQWREHDHKREMLRKRLLEIGVDVEKKHGWCGETVGEAVRREMKFAEDGMVVRKVERDILQESEDIGHGRGRRAGDDDDFVLVESEDDMGPRTQTEDEGWELIGQDGRSHSRTISKGVDADQPQGDVPDAPEHAIVRRQKASYSNAQHPLISTQLERNHYSRAVPDSQVDSVPSGIYPRVMERHLDFEGLDPESQAGAQVAASQYQHIPHAYDGSHLMPDWLLLHSPPGPSEAHGIASDRSLDLARRADAARSAQLSKAVESSLAPANLAFPPFALNPPTITSSSVSPASNQGYHPALKTLISPQLLNSTSHPAPQYHLTVQPPSTFRFKPSDPVCHAALRSYLFPFLPLDPAQYDPVVNVWEVLYVVERSAMETDPAQREDGRDRGVAMSGWGDGTWREERRLVIWRKETGFEKWYLGL